MISTDTFPAHVVDEANRVNFTLDQLKKYTDGVYLRLANMKENTTLVISRLAKKQTMKLFIEVAKLYHDEIGGINFNADYSHIHKLVRYE